MILIIASAYLSAAAATFAALCIREICQPTDEPYVRRLGIVATISIAWLPVAIFIGSEWTRHLVDRYRTRRRRRAGAYSLAHEHGRMRARPRIW